MLLLLIVAHVLVMTLFPTIARLPGAVWDDMLEAWSWGKQFDLGYYKHPPLYAWIVGLWFQILPRTNLSFYFLSALNIGVGLAGVWQLSGLLLRKYARFSCVSLLLFAPSYHYFSTNFNANTIQLSVWPWAAYFLVKSLQTNNWKDGAFFGLLGGCALLGKYYSILFLLSCFVAALLHPNRRSYFRSAAPYCAIAAGAVVFAPHAWWALQTGLPTVQYALAKCKYSLWFASYKAILTIIVGLAFNALGTAILLTALGRRWPALARRVWRSWMSRENAWLVALAFGPLALTMLLGMAGFVKIGPNFLIPTVYMLPLIVVRSLGPALTLARVRTITRSAAVFMMLALGISPLIAYASVALGFDARTQVSPEVARVATNVWHEELGTSVRIAAGTEQLSLAMPFYSPDSPAEFTHYSFSQAPWITAERIAREGLLFVCDATDWTCRDKAKIFETPDSKRVTRNFQKDFWGLRGPVIEIEMLMIPPGMK